MINPARLQQAREVRGFTQTVLTRQVGVHQSAIAQLETERIQPNLEVLDAISRATEFPLAFFTRPSGPAFLLGSLRFRAPYRHDRPSAPASLVVCAYPL
jgi:transcriptional regulator with XRE-family HTH domain